MEHTASPARRHAELVLAQPLEAWVRSRRSDGMSWRRIALDLLKTTAGEVELAPETLRGWFPEVESAEQAS